MRLNIRLASLGLIIMLLFASSALAYEAFKGPLGVLQNSKGVTDGYVLLILHDSKKSWLIDNDGNVVNEWVSEHNGFSGELLPNGNFVRHGRIDGARPTKFGGTAGIIEEFDWDGKKVFEYKFYTPDKEVSHHTFEVMPNGNYLVLGWEYKTYDEALKKGLDPKFGGRTLKPEGLAIGGEVIKGIWPDFIREIDRKNGKTVWEWHVWDNLGAGKKDKIDINKFIPPYFYDGYAGPDWTHFNGLAYNPKTDEICVTSRNLAEVYIINKKTGKITNRWGNPFNYGAGKAPGGYSDDGDQKLFGPHAPDWTPEGTISILDNGNNRPSGNYTRAVELDIKTGKVVWEWKGKNVKAKDYNFYSAYQSGAQKLASGNWMITSTDDGHVIEVTKDKRIVWEFLNPIQKDKIYKTSGAHGYGGDEIHKALRYAKDWPGFKGKKFKTRYQLPNWVKDLSKDSAPMKPMD